MEKLPTLRQPILRREFLVVLLLFFSVLISSPSIFRGFAPDFLSKAVPVLLIIVLAFMGRYRLPPDFCIGWICCFFIMFLSGVLISFSAEGGAPAINGALIMILALVLAGNLKREGLVYLIVRWWRGLFWVISICSIINWILAQYALSFFKEIDFGLLYEGNVRNYLISPFGAIVVQDYGVFALYRVTGILAEPGMMSMFFLVNAMLSFFSRQKIFSFWFGLANVLAAFATHSVAFYFAFIFALVFYFLNKGNKCVRITLVLGICAVMILWFNIFGDFIQGLVERSSFDVRESDSSFLLNRVIESPLASFFGYAWWGEYRQFPAALPQLFYQTGLVGLVAYVLVLRFFLKDFLPIAIVVFMYGLSIDYQTFLIFPLLLFVVKACGEFERYTARSRFSDVDKKSLVEIGLI